MVDNANKPAMPVNGCYDPKNDMGLTKREWFSGLAMQAVISKSGVSVNCDPTEIADLASRFADALLDRFAEDE